MTNISMFTPKFLQRSRKLLEVCHSLATGPNKKKSLFGRVLESVFRKDYFTLQTIVFLTDQVERDNETKAIFAGSILDLSRRVFEDMLYMEYISARDKEKYSKQFIDYAAIDQKNDLSIALSSGIKIDTDAIERIEQEYKKAPTKLKDGRLNWAGQSVDQIITWLVEHGKIEQSRRSDFSIMYMAGNRKNHTSPIDMLNHETQVLLDTASEQEIELGVMIAHGAVARMALFLVEETETDENTRKSIWECWHSIQTQESDISGNK